jgi:hypothetical protein
MSELGQGCVKTCTREERAELCSLFSSFGNTYQRSSFLIRRIRDKRSTREFDLGVFTQPGSTTVLEVLTRDFRYTLENGLKSDITDVSKVPMGGIPLLACKEAAANCGLTCFPRSQ